MSEFWKPYRVVEETDSHVTYEFKTVFLYVLYAILIVLAIGVISRNSTTQMAGGSLLGLYFLTISTQYYALGRQIKRQAREASVEVSGSKWSLRNPLRVRLQKTTKEEG